MKMRVQSVHQVKDKAGVVVAEQVVAVNAGLTEQATLAMRITEGTGVLLPDQIIELTWAVVPPETPAA